MINILTSASRIYFDLGLRDAAAETLRRAQLIAAEYLTGNNPLVAEILFLQARFLRKSHRTRDARNDLCGSPVTIL